MYIPANAAYTLTGTDEVGIPMKTVTSPFALAAEEITSNVVGVTNMVDISKLGFFNRLAGPHRSVRACMLWQRPGLT